MPTKPILVVDYHGVLNSYVTRNPMTREANTEDPPNPGAIAWLKEAARVFLVCVWSGRFVTNPRSVRDVINWLVLHGIPADMLTTIQPTDDKPRIWVSPNRPRAFLAIDDRAIQFRGDFPDPSQLLNFRPWRAR